MKTGGRRLEPQYRPCEGVSGVVGVWWKLMKEGSPLTVGQGVAGSNPVIPTNKDRVKSIVSVQPLFLFGHFVAGLWPFCEQLSPPRPPEAAVQPRSITRADNQSMVWVH